jgi:hypothetical protein
LLPPLGRVPPVELRPAVLALAPMLIVPSPSKR